MNRPEPLNGKLKRNKTMFLLYLLLAVIQRIVYTRKQLDENEDREVQIMKLTTVKENFIKNNVGCIIFMVLVYPEIVMESCLTYEKK